MFKLFDREEKYLHDITPFKATNKEVLNGEDTLSLTIDTDVNIEKKYRVLIKIKKYNIWKEYIVEEIDEDRTDGLKEVYLENSIYETIGDYIEDKRAIDTTANIALARSLEASRWEVGTVENLGIGTATFYRTNVKQAIQDICKEWKAELRTRIVISRNKIIHRYVDLLAKRGNFLGERFVNGDNINKIKRTINTDPIVTALYGYGKGEEVGEGYGRRIDFSTINNGKAYVEDNEARLKWGRLNQDGTKAHIFDKREYDDIEDLQELKDATTEDLELLKDPSVTYEMEIEGAVAQLGDTVIIVDTENEPNLRLTARVYEIENDLLDENNSKSFLGNYRRDITDSMNKQDEYINNFRDKQGIWDRADSFDKEGNLNTQYLNGVIDVLQNKLLSSISGWYTDDNGNIVLDAKDGSSSMMLSGAGFMIANTKYANGNWNYRTFGTGEGFTADEIIAGVLKGGKVKFDLTNGTLLIGNSIEDYTLLWDGTSLRFGDGTLGDLKGADGAPGRPGDDGKTEHLHIKYSNTGGSSFTGNNGNDTGKWIGMYTSYDSTPSSSEIDYTWKLFQGADGKDGDKIYVEYSISGTGSWHPNFATGDIYMRQKVGLYGVWTDNIKIVGTDGEDGRNLILKSGVTHRNSDYTLATYDLVEDSNLVPGEEYTVMIEGELDEINHDRFYLNIYNDPYPDLVSLKKDTTKIGNIYKRTFIMPSFEEFTAIGVYAYPFSENEFESEISKIKLVKGNKITHWSPAIEDVQGEIDASIAYTDVEYYLSTSLTSLVGGNWQSLAPVWVNGKYMWSRTKTVTNGGATRYTPDINGTCISGAMGETGSDGSSVEIQYSVDGTTSWHSIFSTNDNYMRQRIGTGIWTNAIKIKGQDANMLDWVQEWDSNLTQINGKYIVSPKMFAGTNIAGEGLTGTFIGRDDAGNHIGLASYNKDELVALINAYEVYFKTQNFMLQLTDSDGDVVTEISAENQGFKSLVVDKIYSPTIMQKTTAGYHFHIDNVNGSDNNFGEDPSYPARTLEGVLEGSLNDAKYLKSNVTIDFLSDYLEEINLNGFYGAGSMLLDFKYHHALDRINVRGCGTMIQLKDGTLNYSQPTLNDIGVWSTGNVYLDLEAFHISGNGKLKDAIYADNGSNLHINGCKLTGINRYGYNFIRASRAFVRTCRGRVGEVGVVSSAGSLVTIFNTIPGGTSGTAASGGGQIFGTASVNFDDAIPAPPQNTNVTKKIVGGGIGSYDTSKNMWGMSRPDTILQGKYSSYGPYKGLWKHDLSSLVGKTIKGMTITITRTNDSGSSAATPIHLYSHTYTSKPGNPTSMISLGNIGSLRWGETKTFNIPSSAFATVKSGATKGFGVYATGDYSRMYANAVINATYS